MGATLAHMITHEHHFQSPQIQIRLTKPRKRILEKGGHGHVLNQDQICCVARRESEHSMLWSEAMGAAKKEITTALERSASAPAAFSRAEAGHLESSAASLASDDAQTGAWQARFYVTGPDNAGVVTDHAPDLVGLANTHADEVIEQSRQLGVRPPNIVAAAYDRRSGEVFFGENPVHYVRETSRNGIMLGPPDPMHPKLTERMPAPSLENWEPGRCGEIQAVDKGMIAADQPPSVSIHQYERPVEVSDFAYSTIRIRAGRSQPLQSGEIIRSCRNCRVMLGGAVEVTEPGPTYGLFLGGAIPSEHGRLPS